MADLWQSTLRPEINSWGPTPVAPRARRRRNVSNSGSPSDDSTPAASAGETSAVTGSRQLYGPERFFYDKSTYTGMYRSIHRDHPEYEAFRPKYDPPPPKPVVARQQTPPPSRIPRGGYGPDRWRRNSATTTSTSRGDSAPRDTRNQTAVPVVQPAAPTAGPPAATTGWWEPHSSNRHQYNGSRSSSPIPRAAPARPPLDSMLQYEQGVAYDSGPADAPQPQRMTSIPLTSISRETVDRNPPYASQEVARRVLTPPAVTTPPGADRGGDRWDSAWDDGALEKFLAEGVSPSGPRFSASAGRAAPVSDEEAAAALRAVDELLQAAEALSPPLPPPPPSKAQRPTVPVASAVQPSASPPRLSQRGASPVGAAQESPIPPAGTARHTNGTANSTGNGDGEPMWKALRRAAWHPGRPFNFPYEEENAPYDPNSATRLAEAEQVRSEEALKRYEEECERCIQQERARQEAREREERARRDRALTRELRRAQERQRDVDAALDQEAAREQRLERAVEREAGRVGETQRQRDELLEREAALDHECDRALDSLRDREHAAKAALSRRIARVHERRRVRKEIEAAESHERALELRHSDQEAARREWLVAELSRAKEEFRNSTGMAMAMEQGRRMRMLADCGAQER